MIVANSLLLIVLPLTILIVAMLMILCKFRRECASCCNSYFTTFPMVGLSPLKDNATRKSSTATDTSDNEKQINVCVSSTIDDPESAKIDTFYTVVI